jgi:hypothetical protein
MQRRRLGIRGRERAVPAGVATFEKTGGDPDTA